MKTLMAALALLIGAALSTPAQAHEFKLGQLHVDHPWARATIGQVKNGAAYLTVANHSDQPDTLVGVDSPVAKRVELHTHMMEDGVMKMRKLDGIEVNPGEPAVLAPGGLHIMLIGLHAPLVEGESFPLTLTFEQAGSVEVEVKIDKATAKESSGDDGQTHKHGHGSDS